MMPYFWWMPWLLGGCEVASRPLGPRYCRGRHTEVPELSIRPGATNVQCTHCGPIGGTTQQNPSNYLDLTQLSRYWSTDRFNHHTAPTAMVYGLREALRALQLEGLEPRFVRHRLHSGALRAGIGALGLQLFGQEPCAHRLPMLTPVVVPEGIDDFRVRQLHDFGIEIGAALDRSWVGFGASVLWDARQRGKMSSSASPRLKWCYAEKAGRL